MTDKTSWTKPPSLHRYGDSRPAVCGAEGVLGSPPPPPPPPEGGGKRTVGRPPSQGAAPDPVVRVHARSVPGLAVEGPIIFMPRRSIVCSHPLNSSRNRAALRFQQS